MENNLNVNLTLLPSLRSRAIKQEDVPDSKRIKTEPEADDGLDKTMKEQNQIMFKYRDSLKKYLTKNQLAELLEYNHQEVPPGEDRVSISLHA